MQRLTSPRWSRASYSNPSGDTTPRFDRFEADMPGAYEVRNPGAAQFRFGDQLRIIPDTGWKSGLLILVILASAFALLGGIVGLLAVLG